MKRNYAAGKATGRAKFAMWMNGKEYCFEFTPEAVLLRQEDPYDGVITRYQIKRGSCSCPAYSAYNGPCKHILALRKMREHLGLSLRSE